MGAPERGFRQACSSQPNLTVAREKCPSPKQSEWIDCVALYIAINNLALCQTVVQRLLVDSNPTKLVRL